MLVGATEIGGSRPAPSRVTSKASTTTKASPEDVFAIPVTSITSVWLPAPSRGLVYMAVEAAGRVGAKVSTVSTRVPSLQTVATPQTSHGTPIHRTAVRTPGPPNVTLAVTVMVPENVEPSAGEVIVPVGGVESWTVTWTVSVPVAPWGSVTVNLTLVVPRGSLTVGRTPLALSKGHSQMKESESPSG